MQPQTARRTARALLRWYRAHRRDLPWRRTRDPYRIWVSEVMLQQTTVRAVIPHYRRFVRRFPTLRALGSAQVSEVLAAWSGLGYYRRARHLHEACRIVVRDHAATVPADPDALMALPGVGRYTAGAILSIAFGQRRPILDGNVSRVLSRLLLLRGDPRRRSNQTRLWSAAAALVEDCRSPGDLNQAMMELGATLCTPAAPACPRCPVAGLCRARRAGLEARIPPPRRTRPAVVVRHRVALVRRSGRLLMRRRPADGQMGELWEFPPLSAAARDRGDGLRLRSEGRLATVRHSITTRRFLVEVHRATPLREPSGGAYRWIGPRRLASLPISSLVTKILSACRESAEARVARPDQADSEV